MTKTITVTDITRMHGNRVCVAGVTDEGECIRPLLKRQGFDADFSLVETSRPLERGFLYRCGPQPLAPFTRVSLALERHVPSPPHTEDWLLSYGAGTFESILEPQKRLPFVKRTLSPSLADAFGTPILEGPGHYVRAGTGVRSIATVHVQQPIRGSVKERDGREIVHISFRDDADGAYAPNVSDIYFHLYYTDLLATAGPEAGSRRLKELFGTSDLYFRIGLARGWDRYPERCYLMITAIYLYRTGGELLSFYDLYQRDFGRPPQP